MYTQLIHPWEIEIFFQMIRLIPNYGDRHTLACTFTQGLTQLIYFGGFKPPYSEIVRSKSGQQLMEGTVSKCTRWTQAPGKGQCSAAICWISTSQHAPLALSHSGSESFVNLVSHHSAFNERPIWFSRKINRAVSFFFLLRFSPFLIICLSTIIEVFLCPVVVLHLLGN